MKIENLVQTCPACPSQWEFKTDGGKMVYVRYKWGYLSVNISEKETDDVMDAVSGEEIYGETIDAAGWDGEISWDAVKKRIDNIERKEQP